MIVGKVTGRLVEDIARRSCCIDDSQKAYEKLRLLKDDELKAGR